MKYPIIKLPLFILIIVIVTSCGNSQIILSSQNHRVDIKFVENPKKLKTGTTYYLNLIDTEKRDSPLYPALDHGVISRRSDPPMPPFLYTLKASKSGTQILKIYSQEGEGKFILIDEITLVIK